MSMIERYADKIIHFFQGDIKQKLKTSFLFMFILFGIIWPAKAEEKGKSEIKKKESFASPHKEEKESKEDVEKKSISTEVNQSYIRFPPFRIPIIQNRLHKSNFMLEIIIESWNHDKAILIFKNRPRLIHAIFVDLYSLFSVIWYPEFHVELHELKSRLLKICEKSIGNDLIKDILIQKFISQDSQNDVSK